MTIIKRSELNEMSRRVLDEDTGMTALDYWEWSHSFSDIHIIEDEEETEQFPLPRKFIKKLLTKRAKHDIIKM